MLWQLGPKLLPVGTPAPPFICPDDQGRVFILNLQRGKHVVLVFYPADHTPHCSRQLSWFRDAWDRLQARGVVVYGVNSGKPESHVEFRKRLQLPFPLLVDYGNRIARLYRVRGLWPRRAVYLIDREGVIRLARLGMVGPDEVFAVLDELEPTQPQQLLSKAS